MSGQDPDEIWAANSSDEEETSKLDIKSKRKNSINSPLSSLRVDCIEETPCRVRDTASEEDDPYFVSDTQTEDDDNNATMIPPTPDGDPIIIPSTPPEDLNESENYSSEDKTPIKSTGKIFKKLIFDDDEWDKPTQVISQTRNEANDNEEVFSSALASKNELECNKDTDLLNNQKEDEIEDDDWNLRLTNTQATENFENKKQSQGDCAIESSDEENEIAPSQTTIRSVDINYRAKLNRRNIVSDNKAALKTQELECFNKLSNVEKLQETQIQISGNQKELKQSQNQNISNFEKTAQNIEGTHEKLPETEIQNINDSFEELPETEVQHVNDSFDELPETQVQHVKNKYEELPETQVQRAKNRYEELPETQVLHAENRYEELPETQVQCAKSSYEELPETQVQQAKNIYEELPEKQVQHVTNKYEELPETQVQCAKNRYEELPETQVQHVQNKYEELPETQVQHAKNRCEELPETKMQFVEGESEELPETQVQSVECHIENQVKSQEQKNLSNNEEFPKPQKQHTTTNVKDFSKMLTEHEPICSTVHKFFDGIVELTEAEKHNIESKCKSQSTDNEVENFKHKVVPSKKSEFVKNLKTDDVSSSEINNIVSEVVQSVRKEISDSTHDKEKFLEFIRAASPDELDFPEIQIKESLETLLAAQKINLQPEISETFTEMKIATSTSGGGNPQNFEGDKHLHFNSVEHTQMLPPSSCARLNDQQQKKSDNSNDCNILSPDSKLQQPLHDDSCLDITDRKLESVVGTFSNTEDLNKVLQSIGFFLNEEKLSCIFKASDDDGEKQILNKTFHHVITLKEKTIVQKLIPVDHLKYSSGDSQVSSLSTKTSSSSLFSTSGELADISSSASSKSTPVNRSNLLSQDIITEISTIKTSTQAANAVSIHSFIPKMLEESSVVSDAKMSQDDFKDQFAKPLMKENKQKTELASSDKRKKYKSAEKRSATKSSSKKATLSEKNEQSEKRLRSKSRQVKSTSSSFKSDEKPPNVKTYLSDQRSRRKLNLLGTEKSNTDEEYVKYCDVGFESSESSANDLGSLTEILPGAKVMAKWTDGYYYSGMVKGRNRDNRWLIQFDDSGSRVVNPDCLFKIGLLQPGTSVLAKSPDSEYFESGKIKCSKSEGNIAGYVVEHDDNALTKWYSRTSIILSSEQAKNLLNKLAPSSPATSSINLDNVIGGKRKRNSAQSINFEVEKIAETKRQRMNKPDKNDPNLDKTEETSSCDNVSDSKMKSPDSSGKRKCLRSGSSTLTKKPKVSRSVGENEADNSNSILAKRLSSELLNSADNQPVAMKELFQSCAFFLSQSIKLALAVEKMSSDSESSYEEQHISIPFDKSKLTEDIVSCGGVILENFDEIKKYSRRKNIFLVASTYLRTYKYIRCIAMNIPCVDAFFVRDSMSTKKLQDYKSYLLPTGKSIVENRCIEWHNVTDVFDSLKVVLIAEKKSEFISTWAPVLLVAKAKIIQKVNLPSSNLPVLSASADVIITNPSCPSTFVTAAKRKKIPMVSSEWMIQCIISGKQLAYNAHPKFKYDFVE